MSTAGKDAEVHQHGPVAAARPVFVDASGQRGRWIRRVFWALGLLMAAYLAVVFLALVGPPGLSRLAVPGLGPVLPGSGAPGLRTSTGRHGKPASVLSPRAGTPRPNETLLPQQPPSSAPRSTTAPGALTTPSGRPSPGPTTAPTSTGSPTARPTPTPVSPGPRSTQTPPGKASSRPSPRSSHARDRSPTPSPTP